MKAYSSEVRAFAEEVEKLPATGTVDATHVNNLLGKAIQIVTTMNKALLEKENWSLDLIEHAQDRCEQALDRNIRLLALVATLRRQNKILSQVAACAVVVVMVVEVYFRIMK